MNKKSLLQYVFNSYWNVGFIDMLPEQLIKFNGQLQVHWLRHPYRDRWFADPYVLDVTDDVIHLLVEECFINVKNPKGRIALLTIDRNNYELKQNDLVLELDSHLSFPAILRKDDGIYICPENGESGRLNLYRFNHNSRKAVFAKNLINEGISDAVMCRVAGTSFISATIWPETNSSMLRLYRVQCGEYIYDRTISFEKSNARNAGDWFQVGNKLYRPAQNCVRRYGHALEIQEVDVDRWTFKTVNIFFPSSKDYPLGIHTLNSYKGVTVVDGYAYIRPKLAAFYALLSNSYHKLRGIDYRI